MIFRRKKAYNKIDNKSVVINRNTPFYVREAYKAMRTNVMFSVPEEGCKIIAMTSPSPGDGKSTTILNLAITFAQAGKKVLLIDGDMRRPNIKRYLDADMRIGLSDVLGNFCTLEEALCESDYENLHVLHSGNIPPNPAELLSGMNMKQTINILKDYYDYIFIDTPPVNVVTDAAALSSFIDGVIIVVRHNVSRRDELHEAIQRLKFVKAKILGVVVNDREYKSKSNYGRYYKYRKNRYYYEKDYRSEY